MSDTTNDYQNKVHFLGRLTGIIFVLSTFLLPIALWLQFDLLPTREGFLTGLGIVMSLTVPALTAEFLSYAPIIGASAYYVMVVSGNYSNIRIPSTLVALEASDTEPTSEEGEVLGTIAVAVSVITTELILLLGVILLVPFTDFFTHPILRPGFEQIVPSLFAAILVSFALKSIKVSLVPIVISLVVVLSGLVSFIYLIPVVILISIIAARVLYKKGFYQPAKP
jgi:hypothetical protein